jgi:hypothetical protein
VGREPSTPDSPSDRGLLRSHTRSRPASHDRQPVAIDERQLEAEEPRVLLRFVEERKSSSQVVARLDDRDPDSVARLVRRADDGSEVLDGIPIDLRIERQEQALS